MHESKEHTQIIENNAFFFFSHLYTFLKCQKKMSNDKSWPFFIRSKFFLQGSQIFIPALLSIVIIMDLRSFRSLKDMIGISGHVA